MTLPRRRWLVAACVMVAALAIAAGRMLSSPSSLSAALERYDRVHFGMTPAEVEATIGAPPLPPREAAAAKQQAVWEQFAISETGYQHSGDLQNVAWTDGETWLRVTYEAGRVSGKALRVRVPTWRVKVALWFPWLRGLVGL